MAPGHVVQIHQPGRALLLVVVVGSLELGRECAGLNLADPMVSRRHCALVADADGVTAIDLGSTNGIRINGHAVVAPTRLGPHDVLELGTTSVQLARDLRAVAVTEASTDSVASVVLSGPTAEHARLDGDAVVGGALEELSRTVTTTPVDPRSIEQTGTTLTIVFTDIESSTQWGQRLGDQRWFEVLAGHDDVVLRCARSMGGTRVKQRGDGFMLTFPSARRATLFAQDVQRSLTQQAPIDAPIRVRIGLHVGEAINVHGDLFGQHVNLAARVADAAAGGEILATDFVKELVEARGDVVFGPARELTLKGLDGTHVAHEVRW
jgi:class 3 adenylate cyclase